MHPSHRTAVLVHSPTIPSQTLLLFSTRLRPCHRQPEPAGACRLADSDGGPVAAAGAPCACVTTRTAASCAACHPAGIASTWAASTAGSARTARAPSAGQTRCRAAPRADQSREAANQLLLWYDLVWVTPYTHACTEVQVWHCTVSSKEM